MANINENFLNALPEQTRQYFKTHFRIESGYKWGEGMEPDQRDRFFSEMMDLFAKAGWEVYPPDRPSSCPTVRKGGSELYCHPMELSGPCEEHLQEEVHTLLNFAETCRLLSTEVKGQVYDISDEQYSKALESVKRDIEKEIIGAFRTKNKMQYYPGYYDKLDEVADRYHVKTLTRSLIISSDDPHIKYVKGVFQELLQQGKIICKANETHGKMYRAATGPELLELARREASLESMIQKASERAGDPSPASGKAKEDTRSRS